MVSENLKGQIKGLKMVFTEKPQPELLIKIPNENMDTDYEVVAETDEFTSLCPLNLSQPDYATIRINYTPNKWLVELKSLKFYLVSFRQVPIFHEEVPATILKDLVKLLKPYRMEVIGFFTTRGGIDTTVKAVYPSEEGEVPNW